MSEFSADRECRAASVIFLATLQGDSFRRLGNREIDDRFSSELCPARGTRIESSFTNSAYHVTDSQEPIPEPVPKNRFSGTDSGTGSQKPILRNRVWNQCSKTDSQEPSLEPVPWDRFWTRFHGTGFLVPLFVTLSGLR